MNTAAPTTNIKAIAVGRSDMFRVKPSDLHVKDGWNGRNFTDPATVAHVNSLAASIAQVGVKKPLDVFLEDGKLFVSDGECRLRAVLLAIEGGAEIETVPVINENRGTSEADRLLNQIVGNAGKQFEPLEKAGVFKRLLDFGWKESDIAEKSGVSGQHVRDMLSLLAAPAAVKQMISKGDVSPTLALQTLKKSKGDGKAAAKALKDGVAKAKASGKTKATAKHVAPKAKPAKAPKPAPVGKAGTDYLEMFKTFKVLAVVRKPESDMPGMPAPPPHVTVRIPLQHWERIEALIA